MNLIIRIAGVAMAVMALVDFSSGYVIERHDIESEEIMPLMDHGMDHGNSSHGGMDHSMKMYFHASAMSTILFKSWMTHNWQQMLGSCIGLFFIAVIYEGLKIGRELLQKKMTNNEVASEIYPVTGIKESNTGHSSQQRMIGNESKSIFSRIFNLSHAIQAGLHFIQVWLSMALMLVFMTYNVWLCLAVALGAAVGYFAFAWVKTGSSDTNEHCN